MNWYKFSQSNLTYFVRYTNNPQYDLIRGFSCNRHGWVKNEEQLKQYLQKYPKIQPKQDPVTKLWCMFPELGLSGFAFNDEQSYNVAISRLADYEGYNPYIALFKASKFLPAGASNSGLGEHNEDIMISGEFISYIQNNHTYADIEKLINDPITKIPFEAKTKSILDDPEAFLDI